MLSKSLCLILCLPLLILISSMARSYNPRHLIARTAGGDSLNRTACFCASPNWVLDQNYGFCYRIKYYNAHLNRTYTLEPACQSSIFINAEDKYNATAKSVLQNECLRSRFYDPVKYCTGKDTDENVFCYTLAGGADHDTWGFDGQHKIGLPMEPVVKYPFGVVEEVCEESCKEYVGGMGMLKGDALEALEGYRNLVGDRLQSSIAFYPSIPDMCKDCK